MKLKETRLREWLFFARCRLVHTLAVVVALSTAGAPAISQALATFVVQSDRGGLIGQRSQEISNLRSTGARVELRGTCLSACTMYLSLPNVCVSASATLGFHGPTRNGNTLPQLEFDHWSKVMASNYRTPLKAWFMATGRYRTSGYYAVSGAELIRMGYAEC